MIVPADNRSTIVAMNKSDFIAETEKQLSDTHTYKLLIF